jgi:tetratricopeptide (TPR) repeat protein
MGLLNSLFSGNVSNPTLLSAVERYLGEATDDNLVDLWQRLIKSRVIIALPGEAAKSFAKIKNINEAFGLPCMTTSKDNGDHLLIVFSDSAFFKGAVPDNMQAIAVTGEQAYQLAVGKGLFGMALNPLQRTACELKVWQFQVFIEHISDPTKLQALSTKLLRAANHADAEAVMRAAILAAQHDPGANHPFSAELNIELSRIQRAQNKINEAEWTLKRALAIYEQHNMRELDTASTAEELGTMLCEVGKTDVAANFLQRALRLYEQVPGGKPESIARILCQLADMSTGHDAEQLYTKASVLLEERKNPELLSVLVRLGRVREQMGKSAEALANYTRAIQAFDTIKRCHQLHLGQAASAAADLHLGAGHFQEARKLAERALACFKKEGTPHDVEEVELLLARIDQAEQMGAPVVETTTPTVTAESKFETSGERRALGKGTYFRGSKDGSELPFLDSIMSGNKGSKTPPPTELSAPAPSKAVDPEEEALKQMCAFLDSFDRADLKNNLPPSSTPAEQPLLQAQNAPEPPRGPEPEKPFVLGKSPDSATRLQPQKLFELKKNVELEQPAQTSRFDDRAIQEPVSATIDSVLNSGQQPPLEAAQAAASPAPAAEPPIPGAAVVTETPKPAHLPATPVPSPIAAPPTVPTAAAPPPPPAMAPPPPPRPTPVDLPALPKPTPVEMPALSRTSSAELPALPKPTPAETPALSRTSSAELPALPKPSPVELPSLASGPTPTAAPAATNAEAIKSATENATAAELLDNHELGNALAADISSVFSRSVIGGIDRHDRFDKPISERLRESQAAQASSSTITLAVSPESPASPQPPQQQSKPAAAALSQPAADPAAAPPVDAGTQKQDAEQQRLFQAPVDGEISQIFNSSMIKDLSTRDRFDQSIAERAAKAAASAPIQAPSALPAATPTPSPTPAPAPTPASAAANPAPEQTKGVAAQAQSEPGLRDDYEGVRALAMLGQLKQRISSAKTRLSNAESKMEGGEQPPQIGEASVPLGATFAGIALPDVEALIAQKAQEASSPGAPAQQSVQPAKPAQAAQPASTAPSAASPAPTPAATAPAAPSGNGSPRTPGEMLYMINAKLQQEPQNTDLLMRKGTLLAQLERMEEAIRVFDKLTTLLPNDARVWYCKGSALHLKNDFEDALYCFTHVLNLDGSHCKAMLRKAECLLKLGRIDQGMIFYARLLSQDPQFVPGWLSKARALVKQGRFADALSCYDEVLRLDPGNEAAAKAKGLLESKLDSVG